MSLSSGSALLAVILCMLHWWLVILRNGDWSLPGARTMGGCRRGAFSSVFVVWKIHWRVLPMLWSMAVPTCITSGWIQTREDEDSPRSCLMLIDPRFLPSSLWWVPSRRQDVRRLSERGPRSRSSFPFCFEIKRFGG